MVHPTIAGLRMKFASVAGHAKDSNMALRRVPMRNRPDADYSGESMLQYIDGLEARLKAHMTKQAPRWHHQETKRILKRWTAPALNHPAPAFAPRRDAISQASDYAAALLKDRLTARLQRIGYIRLSRSLDMPKASLRQSFEGSSHSKKRAHTQ